MLIPVVDSFEKTYIETFKNTVNDLSRLDIYLQCSLDERWIAHWLIMIILSWLGIQKTAF